ncbi:deaminase [Rhizobium tibeticum]|uniref:deaminase n=1 Tax=Rhizobium tibeticum TaxID=501024 RepID=UPI0027D88093|nr:deaminase [Rhizobium tibeticum]
MYQGVFPVGAVLAAGTRIVGRAHKTMASNHLSHAEMNLYHKVFVGDYNYARAENLTLYTTLEPCVMCFGTTLHLPVTRVVFAMTDDYGGCGATRLEPAPPRHLSRQVAVEGGVRRLDACRLFKEFLDNTTEAFWRQGGAQHFQAAVYAELNSAN